MPLDIALKEALNRFSPSSPFALAAKSGCPFEGGEFRIPFFNRTLFLSHPQGELRGNPTPSPWLRILLLHYLITADGTPLADDWITYRHLPGAQLFEAKLYNLALRPLIQAFGQDLDAFRRAAKALGGIPMIRIGDAAFYFYTLPRLPLACALYHGDEEMAPSGNILFDASAPHYLTTDDLASLGEYLVAELKRLR